MDDDIAVKADSLVKEYNGFTALNGISFEVREGEIFGVVGPNGAGKTTTLKLLSGLLEPTKGSASVAGFSSQEKEMRKHLGFLPEESPLYENMTGVSYLKFFADLYDVEKSVAKERIHDTLDNLGLDHRERKIGDMSKGMKRKVAIARALINDPEVVIFDEPASGLDPLTTNYVLDFTKSLVDEGKTVVFSAHNLYHVEKVCDRVIILNNGEKLIEGTTDDLRHQYGGKTYYIYSNVSLDQSSQENGLYVTEAHSESEVEKIEADIQTQGGEVEKIETERTSLEDIFLSIVEEGDSDES